MTTNRIVYLVGDNDERLDKFKSLLHGFFQGLNIQALNRTAFWKLPTHNADKFIFVFAFAPRYIIYDEDHPSRSFHKEIEQTDLKREKKDAGKV